jgi:hypothetical protein
MEIPRTHQRPLAGPKILVSYFLLVFYLSLKLLNAY